ncbi:hypothetical protein Rleg_5445 (plasmid) [Rhizobium leguminosarum bv. trifolii WSM1325]|uniref:Tetratricopeptide repeat protein n=1 Tax=Rhizobium leguminosarum bv. trifolii (strain WSM1325) TaxID=395491 RepID=C6B8M9_RHILS|nr:hypothetical protein [Rhizobium leguminosarum]ACS60267.1 hypothetical protein Rleg_5445 [Rhizobium leguminosarum bv. trifolii WSM1325]
MEQVLSALYPVAAQVAQPLALAGTVSLLCFVIFGKIVEALKPVIEKITGTGAYKLLMAIITSASLLALVSIVGGIASYLVKYGYETYYKRTALINRGYNELDNQMAENAIRIANEILSEWPDEVQGFNIRGSAYFYQRSFELAANDFKHIIENQYGSIGDWCEASKLAVTQNLIAAMGASDKVTEALSYFAEIETCTLGKDAIINHAKLLMVSNQTASASERLKSVNTETRPDYRDRVNFELGILSVQAKGPDWLPQAASYFNDSACLDDGFKRLIQQATTTPKADPPGNLVQDFGYELKVMKNGLSDQERHAVAEAMNSKQCKSQPGAIN